MNQNSTRSIVDLRVPRRLRDHSLVVLAAISCGGVLGALSRYWVGVVFPHAAGQWPWATWGVNVTGCALIGVLMVLISEVWAGQRLVRPFLGVGVLGGFTTFSTAMVDVQQLVAGGAAGVGLAYLVSTAAASLSAVAVASALTGWLVRIVRRGRRRS